MTIDRVLSRPRRRAAVSLSSPATADEPVEQLDRAVEIIHRVTRALPDAVLDREELIAISGLLTQISGALLTFTDRLSAPVHHYDRARTTQPGADTTPHPDATGMLRDCRSSYVAASNSARAFHAAIKR
ncbi:MAG TPA: hypothetical protein VGJ13_18035 [Pseudonocardiaceae bacterium]|jgi:hypothetical protein